MRVIIQRVKNAQVIINKSEKRTVESGLLVFLGIEAADYTSDVKWLVNKVLNLRIFNDENEIMNHSLLDSGGGLMIISQFTIMAYTKNGNRPSYILSLIHI